MDLNKSRLSNEITREKDSCRETHGDRRENEKKKKKEEATEAYCVLKLHAFSKTGTFKSIASSVLLIKVVPKTGVTEQFIQSITNHLIV